MLFIFWDESVFLGGEYGWEEVVEEGGEDEWRVGREVNWRLLEVEEND